MDGVAAWVWGEHFLFELEVEELLGPGKGGGELVGGYGMVYYLDEADGAACFCQAGCY